MKKKKRVFIYFYVIKLLKQVLLFIIFEMKYGLKFYQLLCVLQSHKTSSHMIQLPLQEYWSLDRGKTPGKT
jgi:hypothetical protein